VAQVPNAPGIVSLQVTGSRFPRVVTAEIPPPFEVLDVNRISNSLVIVNALYNGGASNGDKFTLTIRSNRVSATWQRAIEIVDPDLFFELENISRSDVFADGNGYEFTVFGEGFNETCVVSISGTGVSFTPSSTSFSQITGTLVAALDSDLSTRNVVVTKGAESRTLNNALTILEPPAVVDTVGFTPNKLPQGTTRNYTVTGSGFVSGATVTISGAGVTVNSVTFVNSSQLTANITVASDAALTARDITVTNPDTEFDTLTGGATVTVDTTIEIDEAWLTANGPAPYFLGTEGAEYILQTDVTTPGTAFYVAKRNITFDLNGHTIYYNSAGGSNKWGICLYRNWHNIEVDPPYPGSQRATGFTYHSGDVVCAQPGDRCYAIYGRDGEDSVGNDVDLIAKGKDSFCIHFEYGPANIFHSYLECQSTESFNRHSGPACVRISGKLTARYNVVKGGNSSFVGAANSIIEENVCRHTGFATNGYGGWFYRTSNVVMRNNIIIPSNGRGILANAGNDHLFEDNVILHLEAPNAEFGTSLNPPAIRARYECRGIIFRNNTTLGIAGANGTLTGASSIYVSNYDNWDHPAKFTNNNCTTILVGAPSGNRYAQPLSLEMFPSTLIPLEDDISGNVFKTNETFIRTAGYDGDGFQGKAMEANEFRWIDGTSAAAEFISAMNVKLEELEPNFLAHRYVQAQALVLEAETQISSLLVGVPLQSVRQFWWAMNTNRTRPIIATLTDSIFGSDVTPESINFTTSRSMPVSFRIGVQYEYQLLDGTTPVANFNVTATNDRGDEFALRSDSNGFISVPIIEYAMDKPVGIGQPFTKVNRTETALTVTGYDPWVLDHGDL